MGAEGFPAWLYDGQSAIRHDVLVRIAGDGLIIDDQPPLPLAGLSRLNHQYPVYGQRDMPGWRLGFEGDLPADLADRLPKPVRYGRWIDRIGLPRALVAGAVISAAVVLLAMQSVEWIGRAIPFSWERKLGETMTGDFGVDACTAPEGQAALDDLARRLSSNDRRMRIRVVDVPIVNAVALPGGQILVFRQLITESRSPDELAGVVGHEIGHVEERHVMVALIRRFGLGLVLGSGGSTGEYAKALLDSSYSRGAESEADLYAIAALKRANISPKGTADFFDRLARREKAAGEAASMLGWLASHPPSGARRDGFLKAAKAMASPKPAFSPAQWQAVRAICSITKSPAKQQNLRF